MRSVICVVLLVIRQTTDTLPRDGLSGSACRRSRALLWTIAMNVIPVSNNSREHPHRITSENLRTTHCLGGSDHS
jgi:hypothetical protein